MTRMVPSMHSSCSRSKRPCIKDLETARVLVFFLLKKLGKIQRKIAKKGKSISPSVSQNLPAGKKTPSKHSEIQPFESQKKKKTTDHGKVPRITP